MWGQAPLPLDWHLPSGSAPLRPLLLADRTPGCPEASASPARGYRCTLARWRERDCLLSCTEGSQLWTPSPQTPPYLEQRWEEQRGARHRGRLHANEEAWVDLAAVSSVKWPTSKKRDVCFGTSVVDSPGFTITKAETHAEEDAYESQTHANYDARHCMDVQLCWSDRQI